MLRGHSTTAYDEANDLVTLKGTGDEDHLIQFLRNYLRILFIVGTYLHDKFIVEV